MPFLPSTLHCSRIYLEKSPQSHYFPSPLIFFVGFAQKRDEERQRERHTHISISKHANKKSNKWAKSDILQTPKVKPLKRHFKPEEILQHFRCFAREMTLYLCSRATIDIYRCNLRGLSNLRQWHWVIVNIFFWLIKYYPPPSCVWS